MSLFKRLRDLTLSNVYAMIEKATHHRAGVECPLEIMGVLIIISFVLF